MTKITITKNFKTPTAPGTYYRLICMTGKNKGLSYFFTDKRIILGRSDESDIQVLDARCSRKQLELVFVGNQYVLTDLGGTNKTIVNDLQVSQHALNDNDKIIIGSTVFKYNAVVIEEMAMAVQEDEIEEDEDEEEFEEEEEKRPRSKNKKNNKKMMIYGVAALVLVMFLLPEEKPKKKVESKALKTPSIDFSRKTSSNLDKKIRDKLKTIIHRGRRELREKNFFRAINDFNLALVMDPHNGEASFLLKKTQQRLDEFIKGIAKKAGNETDQKKYRGAILQWCEIIRYLREYPDDERYLDAQKQVDFLAEKLGYEKDAYKCF